MELAAFAFYIFSGSLLISAFGVVLSKSPVHSVFFLILAFFNAAGLFVLTGAEFLAMILILVYVGAVAVLFLFVIMMLGGDVGRLRQTPLPNWSLFFKSTFRVGVFLSITLGFIVGALHLGSWWYEIPLSQTLESLWVVPLTGFDAYVLAACIAGTVLGRAALHTILKSGVRESFGNFFHSFPLNLVVMGLIFCEFIALAFLWGASVTAPEYTSAPIPPIEKVSNTQALGQLIYTDYFYAFQMGGMILLLAMVGAIVLTLRQRSEGIRRQNVADQLSRTKESTLRMNKVMVGKGVDV